MLLALYVSAQVFNISEVGLQKLTFKLLILVKFNPTNMHYCNYNSSLLLHGRNRRRKATGLSNHMSEDEIPDQNHPAISHGFASARTLKMFITHRGNEYYLDKMCLQKPTHL